MIALPDGVDATLRTKLGPIPSCPGTTFSGGGWPYSSPTTFRLLQPAIIQGFPIPDEYAPRTSSAILASSCSLIIITILLSWSMYH
jgi:hypothetical protein